MVDKYIWIYEDLAAVRYILQHLSHQHGKLIAICNLSCSPWIEFDDASGSENSVFYFDLDLFPLPQVQLLKRSENPILINRFSYLKEK